MPESPTISIINGKVWTGEKSWQEYQAVAIAGDKITAVGTTDEIRKLTIADTLVIDAQNRRVIPGITDSHTHILFAGLQLARLDLAKASSKNDFINLVTEEASRLPANQWLLGGQYAIEHWPNPVQPHRSWIDSVTPDNPVFLTRSDLHMALVNSKALELAGINRNGPADPPGGEIERDPATNEPTGIVKDAAMEIFFKLIPPPSGQQNYTALEAICEKSNQWGITSIHDMSLPQDLDVFKAFCDQERLTIRINSYVETPDFANELSHMHSFPADNSMFRVAGFKAFVDGSLGSRTAYMREPFADATENTRYPRGLRAKCAANWENFCTMLRWAHDRKMQLAVHAIGDQAIHDLLDFFQTLPDAKLSRHRIEHVQHLLETDIKRFAELGIIASLQPVHKADDGPWAEPIIGKERMEMMYAWNSLLKSGATVCFGSDVPVVPNNPFAGMAQAVTGKMPDGSICVPAQNITIEQALRCYTITPQTATFRENQLGTITCGKLADIAILDRDILTIDPDEIPDTKATTTIVNGKIVHQ